jgi:hypothetical protein
LRRPWRVGENGFFIQPGGKIGTQTGDLRHLLKRFTSACRVNTGDRQGSKIQTVNLNRFRHRFMHMGHIPHPASGWPCSGKVLVTTDQNQTRRDLSTLGFQRLYIAASCRGFKPKHMEDPADTAIDDRQGPKT